ncbi:succinate dehydrogenase assembly factor 1, mitochondrial isoform X4 [Ambystoma mexicanum]|uniref:succinate dehydrogenase assembly factor 1, mitochondrial isoform X4 n=1 Tax=Ambystoma mexicanum TaxID=8296 RepID=UPI0037E821DA
MKIGLIIVDGGLRRRISHKQNLQLQSEGTLYHWGPCTGTTSKHRRISHKICNCGLKELCVSLEALYRHDIQAQKFSLKNICNCSLKELCVSLGALYRHGIQDSDFG